MFHNRFFQGKFNKQHKPFSLASVIRFPQPSQVGELADWWQSTQVIRPPSSLESKENGIPSNFRPHSPHAKHSGWKLIPSAVRMRSWREKKEVWSQYTMKLLKILPSRLWFFYSAWNFKFDKIIIWSIPGTAKYMTLHLSISDQLTIRKMRPDFTEPPRGR